MTGKGNNHLVPVIIPEDTKEAMRLLSNPTARINAGVRDDNKYVFASLQSESHASGWHIIHNICMKLKDGLEDYKILTATSNRHRLSTLFAMLDLPKKDHDWFYKHMGHSADVNEAIYQAPPAVMELTKVGRHLLSIDSG